MPAQSQLQSCTGVVTVMLAVFSAFPMFANLQGSVEKYFLQALVPDGIAKPVLAALTQFGRHGVRLTRISNVRNKNQVYEALDLALSLDTDPFADRQQPNDAGHADKDTNDREQRAQRVQEQTLHAQLQSP